MVEVMNNYIRWSFIAIGFLSVIMLYVIFKYNKLIPEHFTGTETATGTGTTATGTGTGTGTTATGTGTGTTAGTGTTPSTEPVVMPKTNSLALYINAFQNVEGNIPTYLPGANSWNDFINPDRKKFMILSTSTPPAQLSDGGFPIKNFKLQGPSSNSLSTTDFTSFTMSFYAKVNSLELSKFVKVLQIYAETPNYIILLFDINADTSKINVIAHIGIRTYGWVVPKTSIIGSNLLTVMYNYNSGNPTVDFFINDTVQVLDTSLSTSDSVGDRTSTYSTIKLGLSPMVLNSTLNFDANIYAFAIYSVNLTSPSSASIRGESDLTLLSKYFISEVAGYSRLLLLKQQTDNQNNNLKSQMNSYLKDIASYKDDLNKCTTKLENSAISALADSVSAATKSQLAKWQIRYDGVAALDTADTKSLDSCSPIHVKSFGSSKSDDKKSSYMTSYPSQGSSTPYTLQYPSDDVGASKAAKPDSATTSISSATVTSSSPSIWQSLSDVFTSK